MICFIIFHVIVFFGLVLCATHLSDVTLKIASNIIMSLTKSSTFLEWLVFTDKTLNCDTMVRMELLHYYSAGTILVMGLFHGVEMHYDWKVETAYTGLKECVSWIDEGLINEIGQFLLLIFLITFIIRINYAAYEPIAYEFFTFGDIGIIEDVNYLAVAPHWYFRPFMAWLTYIPNH